MTDMYGISHSFFNRYRILKKKSILNRIGEPSVNLTTTKIQISKVKDKKGGITIDSNEIQGIIRKYL